MSTSRPKATKIEDHSLDGHLRHARRDAPAAWAALRKIATAARRRRDAEIAAMSPEERIGARLVEGREVDAYEDVHPFIMEAGDAWEERIKDPAFRQRVEQALHDGRQRRAMRLLAYEAHRAGLTGPAPTGRMSKSMTRKAIRALVVTRYPKDTKNLARWWAQRIEEPGIVVDAVNYRALRIDLGQLRASLPLLTEDDISPHLASK